MPIYNTLIDTPYFNGRPILAYDNYTCYADILSRINLIANHMTSTHSKVFFMRFDLHFPQYGSFPPTNDYIEIFMNNFIRGLDRASLDPHYLWAYERNPPQPHHHYHICLWLDGQRVQSIYGILQRAESLWCATLGMPGTPGLLCNCTTDSQGFPQENGIMIQRSSPDCQDSFNRAFQWASYLAKSKSKGFAPPGVREFGSSKFSSSIKNPPESYQ